MIWHDKEAFLAQTQPFALHGSRDHLKGLPCSHTVGEKSIISIDLPCHSILLMGPKGNIRGHPGKSQMGTIIFPGTDGIKPPVISLTQFFPPYGIPEDPVFKSLPDGLLFLGGQCRLFLV